MAIKLATINDSIDIWKWRNDKSTRMMSIQPQFISWKAHSKWFKESIENPFCYMFIGYRCTNIKIGICRFDVIERKKSANISININPEQRGKGLATEFLLSSINLYKNYEETTLIATIKKYNERSLSIFRNCGFSIIKENNDWIILNL